MFRKIMSLILVLCMCLALTSSVMAFEDGQSISSDNNDVPFALGKGTENITSEERIEATAAALKSSARLLTLCSFRNLSTVVMLNAMNAENCQTV
jgi:hypothetical protein